jgi:hypothetical protein
MSYEIWKFETARFTVVMTAEPEHDLDLSWDDTGEVAKGIESGKFDVFCAKCAVLLDGREIAADYLGQCIYETPETFRDHIGIGCRLCRKDGKNYGSYFSDMVRQSVSLARNYLRDNPAPALRAV